MTDNSTDSAATHSGLGEGNYRPPQTEQQIALTQAAEEYLRDVIDPELGINVVDLGLLYDVWVDSAEGKDTVIATMTLTSPACPLTDVIEDQAKTAVVGNTEAADIIINWVWMPPWGPHMITEEGREQLRALGFAV